MIARRRPYGQTRARLLMAFFDKYPNDDLWDGVSVALAGLRNHYYRQPA